VLKGKFLASVAAYFVVTMLLAYPWHVLLFHEKYAAMGAITRAEPIVPFGMLAIVLQGIVFSYFYPLFFGHVGGGNPILRGIQYFIFIGITVWTVMVFGTAAKFQIEPATDFVAYGTAFQVIQFTANGVVTGLIYGRNP
jgi:hypothetical protein